MAGFRIHDPRFADVLGDDPRLVRVVDADAHEGPVYRAAEDAVYFTSTPRPGTHETAILRLALDGERFPLEPRRLTVFRAQSGSANGMTADALGRLVVCEQGSHTRPARISRVDPHTGVTETLVDEVGGVPLNSPNDVVVRGDGTVWFTDPSYGFLQGFRPPPRLPDRVYRYDPDTGEAAAVADGLDKPNGLVFSPDESVLYVGDSGAIHDPGNYDPARPHHVLAFAVVGRRLGRAREFATVPGFPDGLAVDAAGRVYISAESGVHVFAPDGALLGEITLPGTVNFTFGGPGHNVLFLTTDTAVWAAVLAVKGAS